MAKKFSPRDPSEIFTVGFDFTDVLVGDESIVSATMEVDLQSGATDPAMATMLMNGLTIDPVANIVAQKIRNGVVGNVYRLDCLATTSEGNKYMLNATQAVIEKNP